MKQLSSSVNIIGKLAVALLLAGGFYSKAAGQGDFDSRPIVECFKLPATEDKLTHETNYDYSAMARTLTANCKDDYEKLRAIYQWICENIAYDTSYSIFTADKCYETRKGVCQAYCDLFYHIAKAAGIVTEIITGKSKNQNGDLDNDGHAWLFAYTRKNHGILLDPTWGAGTVEGKTFTRSKNCWVWFGPDPKWMALSHFPDDKSYQLISTPLSWNEFTSMPSYNRLWLEYGLDVGDIFDKARAGQLQLPQFFNRGEDEFEIIDMPMCSTLQVGRTYSFRIRMKSERDLTIINNKLYVNSKEWTAEGNGVYSIDYMVRDVGPLKISISADQNKKWYTMLLYNVQEPNDNDWKKVEKHYPLSVPDAKRVGNLDARAWQQAGIDEHRLLQLIRQSGTQELPVLYTKQAKQLKIISVPMQKTLHAGSTYTFSFLPLTGIKWAIINEKNWYREWSTSDEGTLTMTVTPTLPGSMALYVQTENNEPNRACLEYDVTY